MANGGFNPAYNIQLATDIKTKIIVGLQTTNQETDYGLISPMQMQVINRYGIYPKNWLADGGYGQHEDIEEIAKFNPDCKIYMPPRHMEDPASYMPKDNETQSVKDWRVRMGNPDSKHFYKQRAATAEYVNANARNRNLIQLNVRGQKKVNANMALFVLVNNMTISWKLDK